MFFTEALIHGIIPVLGSLAMASGALPGRFFCSKYFSQPVYRTYFLRDNPEDFADVAARVEAAGGTVLFANPEKGTLYFQSPRPFKLIGSAVEAID